MKYNRTEEAKAMLADIEAWCARTSTPPNSVGHALFLHPGFVGLLRKRLTLSEEKEAAVRQFLEDHPDGYQGELPKTHANGTRPVKREYSAIQPRRLSRAKTMEEGLSSAVLVDRDPCPRCGVRADIGCHHTRAPLGMIL